MAVLLQANSQHSINHTKYTQLKNIFKHFAYFEKIPACLEITPKYFVIYLNFI